MQSNEDHTYLQTFPYGLPRLHLQISKPLPIDYQAFPYSVLSLSLWITKPFPIGYKAFAYILPSLSLWITKPFRIDPAKSVQNLKKLESLVNMYGFHYFSMQSNENHAYLQAFRYGLPSLCL